MEGHRRREERERRSDPDFCVAVDYFAEPAIARRFAPAPLARAATTV
jgi:hypothetical protein